MKEEINTESELVQNQVNDILPNDIESEVEAVVVKKIVSVPISELQAKENYIRDALIKGFVKSKPMLLLNDIPIIYKGTRVSIQGQKGSFKTSLARKIVVAVLKNDRTIDSIGLSKDLVDEIIAIYVNSEMAELEEFSQIVQKICIESGISLRDNRFRFTSIQGVKRNQRLKEISNYLVEIRKTTNSHIFLVLDVVTDLILDFNSVFETYEVIDELDKFCRDYNCTILQIIHENPGSYKARGNLGTEIVNKASTQMRISNVYQSGKKTGAIKLEFVSIRSNKEPDPILLEYSESLSDLIPTTKLFIKSSKINPEIKKSMEVVNILADIMDEQRGYTQKELISSIQQFITGSDNTIITRLNTIIREKLPITDSNGNIWIFENSAIKGKSTLYNLKPKESELEIAV